MFAAGKPISSGVAFGAHDEPSGGSSPSGYEAGSDSFEPGIVKDLGECCVSAVRERIRPALAIMRDKSVDGHGLHSMV